MRPPTFNLVPEYPPRVRIEWLIAISSHRACRRRAARRCGEPGRRAGHVVAGLRARLVPALQRPCPGPGVPAGALRARLGRRAARLRSRRVALPLLHRQRHQSFLRLLHFPGNLPHAALGDTRRRVDRGGDGRALRRHQCLHVRGARAQTLGPNTFRSASSIWRSSRCWSGISARTTTASSASSDGSSRGRGACRGSPMNWLRSW